MGQISMTSKLSSFLGSLELKEKQLSNKKYKIQNKERKIVAAPHLMPKFITAAWNYNSR